METNEQFSSENQNPLSQTIVSQTEPTKEEPAETVTAEVPADEVKEEITSEAETEVPAEAEAEEAKKEEGFSLETDDYGREILEDNFQNVLRMSVNLVKLNYSQIKNTILSYAGVRAIYETNQEIFKCGRDIICIVQIKVKQLLLYISLPSSSLDKKVYPHRTLKSKEYKLTPTLLTVSTPISLSRAKELIDLTMRHKEITKLEHFTPVAYAESYPVNPNAVIRGKEGIAPKDAEYLTKDYEDIFGELTANIVNELVGKKKKSRKKKSGTEVLAEGRQVAKTIKGAVAMTEPIVYFYNLALSYENKPQYVTVTQVLNDRYLGKLIPQMYFAVAEGSERIESLNFLTLKKVTEDCNANPQLLFCTAISCRMLIKAQTRVKLVEAAATQNGNLILALDCALLEALGENGLQAVRELKNAKIKVMLDNTERAGMKILTDCEYDFLRFDGRYYHKGTPAAIAHLKMLTGFAKTIGIDVTSTNVENQKDAVLMIENGVDTVEGDAIGTPKRLISLALKEFKVMPPVERQ